MKANPILENLRQDLTIPDTVQTKANEAFRQIQESASAKNSDQKIVPFWRRKKAIAIASAICLCASTLTVSAAAYHFLSQSLKEELHISDKQEAALKDSALSNQPMKTATDAGVTVTAVQSIADRHYAYLAFKVEGPDFSKYKDPVFDSISATLDGKDTNIYGGSFRGNEYRIVLSLSEKTDSIIGKEIRVKFKNLGDSKKTEFIKTVDGNWDLAWTLKGSSDIKTYEFSEKLGDSNATLTSAEISPISLNLTFHMPRTMIKETYIDETTNKEGVTETYAEPPVLAGIRMKNGTLYTSISNGGATGYQDDTSDICEVSMILNRILDVSNVDSLLFLKEGVNIDSESEITEDICYSVPVK